MKTKNMDMQTMLDDLERALTELIDISLLKAGDVLVLGCSTSEMVGERIGQGSAPDIGEAMIHRIMSLLQPYGIHLATQCCEHLNRALVLDQEVLRNHGWPQVQVVPYPKAGGSLSSAYYRKLFQPAVAEYIQADAGLDIGDTLIGMHLKPVAIPVRLGIKQIGSAHITAARTRPKLIGGERAKYSMD